VDDPETGTYTNSVYQGNENSIMNLGHGRAGHFPDYSWARYKYMPAWGSFEEIVKDNPSDYLHAFCQMVYALKYLRGDHSSFKTEKYDVKAVLPWKYEIGNILLKRQTDSCSDWKALAESISGRSIEDFDMEKYQNEYIEARADRKDDTFLGKFIVAALAQKSMVTNRIFNSGNKLAGYSIDYDTSGLKGIKDFHRLVGHVRGDSEQNEV
jgi:hypothetical protein